MYPTVKVGKEGIPVALKEEESSSLLLRVFESLSVQDRCSQGNEDQNDSPPHAKVPKTYIPNVPLSSIAVEKVNNNNEVDEDIRPYIRASSVPRPRAVLSSPDNDDMIGSMNKLSTRRQTVLKNHNSSQNTHVQGKVKNIRADRPLNTRRVSKEVDDKGHPHPQEKHTTGQASPRQKPYIRKGKPQVP
ncbi:uncharacterized protein LOC143862559 [Tasmannia lanceolata]|uniref:uncharacterized protein LOC143862559 n=1 Tax=Tasmannia lanceolata TaxID=3420 RepID=UPI004064470D